MKFLRNKFFLAIICVILAAVVAFLILPRFYSSQAATTQVVRLTQNVSAGTVLTESMLTTSNVGAYGLSGQVVLSKEDAVGMVALENLYVGEMLWSARIVTAEEYETIEEELTKGLKNGQCLVTIALPSTSSGLASVLRSGHFVDVFEFVENEEEYNAETGVVEKPEEAISVTKVLSGMYVYDVLNVGLDSLDDLDALKETLLLEEADGDFDFEPVYVVFRCSEAEALTLIRLEKSESLHLTLTKSEG